MQYFHLLLILLFGAFRKSVNLTLHESRDESCGENLIQTYQQTTFLSLNCQNDLKTELMCAKKQINEVYTKVNISRIRIINCELFDSPNSLKILEVLNITHADVEINDANLNTKVEKIMRTYHGVQLLQISTDVKTVNDNFLQNYRNLSGLSVSFFKLAKVPKRMFSNLKHLKSLYWYSQNNKVFEHADIKELLELDTITINYNSIMFDGCKQFPLTFNKMRNLKKIILDNTFGNCIDGSLFKGAENLVHIEITENQYLIKLPDKLFEDQINLLSLTLQGNGLESVNDILFVHLKKLRYLYLWNNNIKEIDWVSPLFPNLETVDLRWNSGIKFNIVLNSTNFKTIECSVPDPKTNRFKSNAFLCYTEGTCEFLNDRINIKCPEHCECHLNKTAWDFIVNCTNKSFVVFPPIPMPNVGKVSVYLQDNYLKMLPNKTLYGYFDIVKLYVSGNELTSLSLEQLPPNITHLDLSNNKLTTIKWEVLNFLENIQGFNNLYLAKNPWRCDCDLIQLLGFIEKLHKKVLDSDHIRCSNANINKTLIEMEVDDICPSYLILIISLVVAFIMLLLLLIIVYLCNRQIINEWLYEHNYCLRFITEELLDKNMLFDAFISYSTKDSDILHEFVDRLEKCDDPFKLCLHDRNWLAGDCITERIERTVEHSKRVIIILSQNFLESTWGLMEFRLAYQGCMQHKRRRLIVVLYNEPKNFNNLDSELKAYLQLNTYIRWDDSNFWRKLRYAMPHRKPHLRGTPYCEQNVELEMEYIM